MKSFTLEQWKVKEPGRGQWPSNFYFPKDNKCVFKSCS